VGATVVVCPVMLSWTLSPDGCASPGSVLTILIYGASEAALYSILWPVLENGEIWGNKSPSRKGNFLSNLTPHSRLTADRGEYKNRTYLFAILLHILNT
jgi:hypothetical protein